VERRAEGIERRVGDGEKKVWSKQYGGNGITHGAKGEARKKIKTLQKNYLSIIY
jgi:hypothetical protein